MTKGRKRKSDKLPKYGTPTRTALISILPDLPAYKEALEKGLPLYTKNELDELIKKYEKGITWEEIDKELSRKGIFLKKVTFRKYIQNNYISEAKDYRNTEKGRVAVFPADTIPHLNFIQYFYKVDDGTIVDYMLDLLTGKEITYKEAIESRLEHADNIYAAIFYYICFDNADAEIAINEALLKRPDDRDTVVKMLEQIDHKFESVIMKDIEKLVSFVMKKKIPFADAIHD